MRLPAFLLIAGAVGFGALTDPAAKSWAEDKAPQVAPPAYRLEESFIGAKTSYYSNRILKFLDHWPPPTLTITDADREIYTRAIKTPGHSNIVGMVKHFNIRAPLEKVAEVTERFEDYPSIWEGVLGITVESRDRNRLVTEWKRKAPTFFMPRLHYRLAYVIDRSRPDRVVYRQQLIDGNALKTSDGIVVLEKRGTHLTRLSIITFFDPDAGPFRGLVEGVIWSKSIQNSYKDDVAFRAHLEHPDWNVDRLSDESDHEWDKAPLDPILYTDQLKFD